MSPFPIVIRLAGEPEGKGRARFSRKTGRAFTPAKTRSYEGALRLAAQDVMGERDPLEEAVFVTVTAGMPVPASWSEKKRQMALAGLVWPTSRPDADNFAKCCDALNEIVFRDDKQIVALTVVKTYSARPELLIVVRPAEREHAA